MSRESRGLWDRLVLGFVALLAVACAIVALAGPGASLAIVPRDWGHTVPFAVMAIGFGALCVASIRIFAYIWRDA